MVRVTVHHRSQSAVAQRQGFLKVFCRAVVSEHKVAVGDFGRRRLNARAGAAKCKQYEEYPGHRLTNILIIGKSTGALTTFAQNPAQPQVCGGIVPLAAAPFRLTEAFVGHF